MSRGDKPKRPLSLHLAGSPRPTQGTLTKSTRRGLVPTLMADAGREILAEDSEVVLCGIKWMSQLVDEEGRLLPTASPLGLCCLRLYP